MPKKVGIVSLPLEEYKNFLRGGIVMDIYIRMVPLVKFLLRPPSPWFSFWSHILRNISLRMRVHGQGSYEIEQSHWVRAIKIGPRAFR
jgi:hypothetical protein